jgi:outer membrane receptor protein involved in Fe transport
VKPFFTNALNNSGTGSNIGIDFTLEQFITNGFYYMITASVYESKFKGGDGIERNTRYNQNYVFNVLAGKEWQTKRNHTFGINGKFTLLGGKRQSPVDMEKSLENQFVVYDDSRLYDVQLPTSFYIDLGLNYTINRPKCAHSFIIQAKNILMQEENLGHAYNFKTQSIETYGLEIIYPYISYKIQF